MNKIQKIMSAIAAIVLLVSVTMLTFSFKPYSKTSAEFNKRAGYYFKYNGPVGSEQDITLWQQVDDPQEVCEGANDGCLIEVNPTYTQLSGTTIVINPALAPTLPYTSVTTSTGTHKNPTVGTMILNAFNKNP